jgi:AcrR family transcriptional regulator
MPRFVAREDHRVRVARQRRDRTRTELLQAVLAVYPGDGANGAAVIDDVIREAGVARGTFYKYFPSLEDAVAELGTQLANEMAASYAVAFKEVEDPIERAAMGFLLTMFRAAIEPRWGMFVTHLNHYREGEQEGIQRFSSEISKGLKTGAFQFDSLEAAADLTVGATVEGIRRLIAGTPSIPYVENLTCMLLCGLGAKPSAARRATAAVLRYLREQGQNKFAWWRPLPQFQEEASRTS